MKKILFFDFETSMKPNHLPWNDKFCVVVGCFIPNWKDEHEFIWFDHSTHLPSRNGIQKIQALIDEADLIAAHNIKYDCLILKYLGINFDDTDLWCTMVADFLITGQNTVDFRFNLDAVSQRRGLPPKLDVVKTQYWSQNIETYDVPDYILSEYVYDDAYKVQKIYESQQNDIEGLEKVLSVQNEFTKFLVEVEYNGLRWDSEKADEIISMYEKIVFDLHEKLMVYAEDPRLNLSSGKQLSAFLYGAEVKVSWLEWTIVEYKTKPYSRYYEKPFNEMITIKGLGFTPPPRSQTKDERYYQTRKDVLAKLKAKTPEQKEVLKILGELSSAQKVVETLKGKKSDTGLVNKVQSDGCIHPKMNQTVAKTGRLSSSDPNGQNLPSGNTSPIKKCIIPYLDGIMEFDLSQIEWRDAGFLSQDKVMIHEINMGIDQHIAACVDLMEIPFKHKGDPESDKNRTDAKIFNFRMIYGGSAYGYYMDNKMPNFSRKKWNGIVSEFERKYSGLIEWQNYNIQQVYNNQGWLVIPTGRRFKFHQTLQSDGSLAYNERQIKNYPVQGNSGGDILPLCANIIRRGMIKNNFQSKIILTVHDSVLFDYIEEEKDRLARMCIMIGRNLPKYISYHFGLDWNVNLDGEIKIGPNYGAMKDYHVEV